MSALYHYDALGNASTEWLAELDAMSTDERTHELMQAVQTVKRLELVARLADQVQWLADAEALKDRNASCRALDAIVLTVAQLSRAGE